MATFEYAVLRIVPRVEREVEDHLGELAGMTGDLEGVLAQLHRHRDGLAEQSIFDRRTIGPILDGPSSRSGAPGSTPDGGGRLGGEQISVHSGIDVERPEPTSGRARTAAARGCR